MVSNLPSVSSFNHAPNSVVAGNGAPLSLVSPGEDNCYLLAFVVGIVFVVICFFENWLCFGIWFYGRTMRICMALGTGLSETRTR